MSERSIAQKQLDTMDKQEIDRQLLDITTALSKVLRALPDAKKPPYAAVCKSIDWANRARIQLEERR